jgi:hypothetical protein
MFSRFSVFQVYNTSDLFALQDIANYVGSITAYNLSTNKIVQDCVTELYRNTFKSDLCTE